MGKLEIGKKARKGDIISEKAFGIWAKGSMAAGSTIGSLGIAGAMVPFAYADEASSAIESIFGTARNSILMPVYYGLLSVIAVIALIVLIVEIVQGATSPSGRQNDHIKQCIIIIVLCLVMGFAPTIINYIIGLGDSGVADRARI